MARAKSAVLTPEQKKSVLAEVKARIKDRKDSNKEITKLLLARSKDFEKSAKAFNNTQKVDEKQLQQGLKDLVKLEAELAGLTGVKAVAAE